MNLIVSPSRFPPSSLQRRAITCPLSGYPDSITQKKVFLLTNVRSTYFHKSVYLLQYKSPKPCTAEPCSKPLGGLLGPASLGGHTSRPTGPHVFAYFFIKVFVYFCICVFAYFCKCILLYLCICRRPIRPGRRTYIKTRRAACRHGVAFLDSHLCSVLFGLYASCCEKTHLPGVFIKQQV